MSVPVRVMVVWCPDWSVVAALDEAEPVAALPRRRALRQRRRGVQRPRPRRGRTPRAASPRRPGPVPRARAAAGQPRPRRARLRAGAGHRRGPASRGGRAAPRPARRPRARQLVRHRDRRRRDGLPGTGRGRRLGRPRRHRRRPLHRRAGRSHRRRAVVDGRARRAGPRRSCAACPVHVLQDDGPRGRELVGLLQRLGLRTPRRPGRPARARPSSTGSAPTAPRSDDGPAARTAPSSPPAPRRPSSTPTCPSSLPSTPSRRSPSACAPPPSGSSPSWRTTSSSPPACGSRPSPTASSARRAPGCTRATSAPATWSTGCTGSCSRPVHEQGRRLAARPQGVRHGARPDRPDQVRARGGRARRRPRRGAVGQRRPTTSSSGAWPGCRAWSASTPYAGRCCRAVAAPRPGSRWCRGASARSTCARSTGRGPAGCPGPAPVRVFATPPTAEVVDDAGRDVCVTDRGVVSGEPRRFRVAGAGDGQGLPWQPVTAWAGPWPTDESWWSGGTGPIAPASRSSAPTDVPGCCCARPTGWSLEAGYD